MNETTPPQTYRCDRCGIESTIKEAFLQRTDRSGKVLSSLCFECKTKKDAGSFLGMALLLGGMGVFLSFLPPHWAVLGRAYLQMFAGLVLILPMIVLHELSHALAGRLLGLRVFAIHLGAGSVVYTRRLWGMRWYIKQFPVLGLTIAAGPALPRMRLRIFLLHLAGPALHALLIVALVAVLGGLPAAQADGPLGQALWIGVGTNLLLLLTNLYPRKAAASLQYTGTDGWAMLNSYKISEAELQKRYALYYVLQAVDAVDRGDKTTARQWAEQGLALYPQQVLLINALGYVYSNMREHALSRAAFLQVLNCAEKPPESIRLLALNNVAFANLMLGDPALLAQADEFSQTAYKNIPWEPVVGGTRGGVLVALGQVAEGVELLRNAMARNTDPHGKALEACLIATGELKRGNWSEAEKYLAAAQKLDPDCELLPGTRQALQARP